jgi:hypothetical protein
MRNDNTITRSFIPSQCGFKVIQLGVEIRRDIDRISGTVVANPADIASGTYGVFYVIIFQ